MLYDFIYITFLNDKEKNRLLVAGDENGRKRGGPGYKKVTQGILTIKLFCLLVCGSGQTCELHRTHTQTNEYM